MLPALTINYLGQGALLLGNPEAIENPFYIGVPEWALYPMVGLATAATVIASQAVISGAYSATRQAIQLGYLPRMAIRHTSRETIGQIYMPSINWVLMLAVIATVIGFGSSTALATAYGVSVTGTMLITSIILIVAMRARGTRPNYVFWPLAVLFVLVDVAFLFANLVKFMDGAWFPDRPGHRGVHAAAHLGARTPAAAERDPQGRHQTGFLPSGADALAADPGCRGPPCS